MSELPSTYVPGFHDEKEIRKMKYNLLGKTDLMISELSLGGGPLGGIYGPNSLEECIKTVRSAIKSGINYIDTAPWYGQGRSEEVLGMALKDIPREAYYIGTKVGRYEQDIKNMFDFTAEKTKWSVDNSLKKLGLEYVDIIQVHDVEFANMIDQVVNECLPTLEDIVRQGKAHYIGITGYPLNILKKCLEMSKTNISTVLSYSRCTLIDNTLSEYIPYFQALNLGIINAASIGMGLLSNKGPQQWHPASQDIKDICREASEYCKLKNVELGRLASNYPYSIKAAHTNVVGMDSLALLEANLDVCLNGISEEEHKILNYINTNIFSKLDQIHWEGVEIAQFKDMLNMLGNRNQS